MQHFSYEDFHWKDNELYFKKILISRIVEYQGKPLYRIQWPDGIESEDHYNLSRAKDNALKYAIREYNQKSCQESP